MRIRKLSPARSAARLLGRLLALGFCAAVFGHALVGLNVHVVLTGSMRPHLPEGSVIVTRTESTRNLTPGRVIVFTPPGHTTPIAHRVVQISGSPDHPTLVTKGDANPTPDEWRAALMKPRVPIVIGSIPAVGRLLVLGHVARREIAVGLVALIGLALTLSHVRRMRRSATCPGCADHSRSGHRQRETSPGGPRTAPSQRPNLISGSPHHS